VQRPEDERHGIHYAINHRVRYDSDMTYQFYLYSLAPDLYGCRTLRGDLHCHTWESDGRQDAARTVGNYRAWGHDFLAITDHYVHFAAEKAMKLFADAPLDMTLLFGEEVHLPTERIHAVHVGGRESINADWRTRPEEIRVEVAKIMEDLTVDEGVHPEDYAWRIWIARRAKDFGGISMLAHPQWVWNYTYFMADVTTEQLLREGIHDALELNSATGIDSTVAMWADLRAQGVHIPLVGVSDGHNNDTANGMPGAIHTIVVAKDRSFASIADELIDGMKAVGAYLLSDREAEALSAIVMQDVKNPKTGITQKVVSRDCVGRDAAVLLAKIGVKAPDGVRCLIYETEFSHMFVQHELMMPILPIVRVRDIDEAIELAVKAEHGNRHTAHMHSKNIDHLTRFARAVETTIFVKNAPSYAGIGFGGEGHTTFTIAGPTGEGITSAKSFTRLRRCVIADSFRII
jgi:hypothetical protein